MLTWIRDNVDLLNMLSSFGMLAIWLLYLQLFYRSYRRARKPNLLIHQANGFGLDSICMIANMSATNVHVAALLIDAESGDDAVTFQPGPTRPDPVEDDDPLSGLHVGPLTQGSYFRVGTFRTMVAEAVSRIPEAPGREEPLRLGVRLVAFVGPELEPIGARRTFEVSRDGERVEVRATELLPEQLAHRRQRRIARRWLEEAQELDVDSVVTFEEEKRSVERLEGRAARGDREARGGSDAPHDDARDAREAAERPRRPRSR